MSMTLLALIASAGCRPSELAERPAEVASAEIEAQRPEEPLEECPNIEFAPVSTGTFGPQRPIGLYLRVQSATESYDLSLAPLVALTGETPWSSVGGTTPLDTLDAVEELQMQMFYSYTPGYRVGETCGRLAVHNDYQVRDVEAFVAPDGPGRLALYDSLGQRMMTLGESSSAGPGSQRPEASASKAAPVELVGSTVRTSSGKLDLSRVLPYGRWYARPAGVRIGESDRVLVHVCDVSNPSDLGCGFDSDGDGQAEADPSFPFVTHLSVRTHGDELEFTPHAVDWHESSFAGVDPYDRRVGRPLRFPVSP